MSRCFGGALALLALAALHSQPLAAEKAVHLTAINGLDAAEAETELRARGFEYADSNTNTMGYTYSYWWDAQDKNCVRAEAHEGRIETIVDASDKDCHHGGGGNAAAAVGVVAGAAILGALLSHKSHHHEDDKHYESAADERLYESGYRDGLYNAPYHSSGRSDAYSSGYRAGVDERRAKLDDHTGHGGYSSAARFADLRGARAAGAMDELKRRGFRQVDNFTSGNTRYSIQWRGASRQCVQVTIAEGKIYDARDIGRHPKCH